MPVQLASSLIPRNGQTFSLLEDIYLKGGFVTVADTAARDALPSVAKKAGMIVATTADDKCWQYSSSGTWVEIHLAIQGAAGPVGPTGVQGEKGIDGVAKCPSLLVQYKGDIKLQFNADPYHSVEPVTIRGAAIWISEDSAASTVLVLIKKNGTTVITMVIEAGQCYSHQDASIPLLPEDVLNFDTLVGAGSGTNLAIRVDFE